jgi:hypothetical protein
MNKETWEPDESDINETFSCFRCQFDKLVDSVNTYWFAGKAKNQAINIASKCMNNMINNRDNVPKSTTEMVK